MLLHQLNQNRHAQLMCAVMEHIKPAGGEHRRIAELDCTTGHLVGEQIEAYSSELKKRSDDRPMHSEENAKRLLELIKQLDEGYFHSLFIVRRGVNTEIHGSWYSTAFDDLLAVRDKARIFNGRFLAGLRQLDPVGA